MKKDTHRPALCSDKRGWAVLMLLVSGIVISYVDRTSLSSALADKSFVANFGLTSVDRGWINSVFFWSYGAFQVPMGWVADRYGVKWPYAICFAMWCLATALIGTMTTVGGLIIMRLVVGATEAVVVPASYRWIRNNLDESRNGLAVGLLAMGNKLGPAVGALVAAWFIVNFSWRVMFVATGAAGLVWLVPWLLLTPSDYPSKAQLAQAKRRADSVTLTSVLASPVVWGGMTTNFCYGYFTFYCMTWMPSYLVEQRGLSLSSSGLYTFISFAGIALVAVVAGVLADALIARGANPIKVRKAFTVAGFVGGCTVLLGVTADSLDVAVFWNVLSLSLLGLTSANNLALSRLTLIPGPAIGLVTGVQQLATSLAGGVAAGLSGWLLHIGGSYELPMMAILAFLLLGAAATLTLFRPEWSPKLTVLPESGPPDAPHEPHGPPRSA